MPKTTSNLPICIHCGTPRPADETLCPKCGKPWIDVRIAEPPAAAAPDDPTTSGDVAAAAAAAAAAATPPPAPPPVIPIEDTGEFGMDEWTLPPDPPSSKAIWLLPVALVVAVIAFWSFVYFGGDSPTSTTVAAQPSTTTTQAVTTTVAEVVEETTTTSSTTTTTTVPYPPASDWTASGDPLSTVELPLKAGGIGPIDFGSTLGDVAGQLVASLGSAEAAGDSDVCPPAETYWLQWGQLRAIFDGWEPDATFVSYRYEETDDASEDVALETLSGLQLGQTVAQLKSTYDSYTVTLELIDGQDHFRLVDGGDLLLWGPVSSPDDDGIVLGIFSPSPCP
ncbi:MAG: zinc ribbon domain-containing protein [Armatimonadetes bacterium]|nr:MAG: zinc ribbon domain-containing protein [Armatimonadota bacterium]